MSEIDHYIWKSYCLNSKYDRDTESEIHATTKKAAQERILDETGVSDVEWRESDITDYPLFKAHHSDYHVIGVKRIPVYGDGE